MACSHLNKAAKDAWDEIKKERDNLDDDVSNIKTIKEQFDNYESAVSGLSGTLSNYSSALNYVSAALKYVIVNSEPFDKGICKSSSKTISKTTKALNEYSSNIKKITKKMGEAIKKLEAEAQRIDDKDLVNKAEKKYDKVKKSNDKCAACKRAEFLADQSVQSSKKSSSTTNTTPVNPRAEMTYSIVE